MTRHPHLNNLPAKKRIFVLEYLKDFKRGPAAVRAGASAGTGSTWFNEPGVQDAIEEQMTEKIERTQIDADWLLKQEVDIYNAQIGDVIDNDGTVRPINQWPEIWQKIVTAIDVQELFEGRGDERQMIGLLKKIKGPDKLKVLEMIGKHRDIGAFIERIEVVGVDELSQRLAAGRQRAHQRNSKEMSFL